MRVSLPSEITPPADDHPLVLADPTPEHRARSAEAMHALAEAASSRSPKVEPVDVTISHLDVQGCVSPLLYSFQFVPLGDEDEQVDAVVDLRHVHFVSVLNQPIARQIESMVTMLAQLVERQRHIDRLMARQREEGTIDLELAAIDDESAGAVVDVLRHGWRTAAEQVARDAADAGQPLRVRYQADVLCDPEAIGARGRVMRRMYNEMPLVRSAIDRVVSRVASGGYIVSGSNTPERMARHLQQHYQLSGVSQYFAQALRDGFVLGNGYITYTDDEPLGAYNLHPVTARLAADEGLARPSPGSPVVPVTHCAGFHQTRCAYGLSCLEALLPVFFQSKTYREAEAFARQLIRDEVAEGIEWAHRTLTQVERVLSAIDQKVSEVLLPMTMLPDPVDNLYFEGCESL